MSALFWGVILAAGSTVAANEAPIRVAVSGLQGVNVPAEALTFYAEHVASNLRAPGLSVVTAREISTLLGLERQKQLLGCGEAVTSCIAEMANALGVDAVIVGDVAKFGQTYQLNLKALNAADAKVLASRSARVEGDVAALDALARLGRELSGALFEAKGRTAPVELKAAGDGGGGGPSVRTLGFIPLGVGVVAAGVGGVLIGLSRADYAALTGSAVPLTPKQALDLRTSGANRQTAGVVLAAVGAAAIVTAGAMFLFGAPKESVVAVTPVSQGAVVSFAGVLP
jgi:hypothetical protein